METSSWAAALLESGPRAELARTAIRDLRDGAQVFASRLTLAELARVIVRKRATRDLTGTQATRVSRAVARTKVRLSLVDVNASLLERAGRAFAVEPIRTLDAIHVATALALQNELGHRVTVISNDDRVRDNARRYGLGLLPTVHAWRETKSR